MLNKNPTVIINGLSGLITQVLPLLVILGVINPTPQKLAALIALQGLILTYVSTVLIKSQVSTESTVRALVEQGIKSDPSTSFEEVKTIVRENKEDANSQK